MNIQLYEAEAVISRRGGGKRSGARYAKYTTAIQEHLSWLFEQIDTSKDGAIRIKLADFAAATGFKMQKIVDGKAVPSSGLLNPVSVGWGFKYSLFHAGIVTSTGKIGDGQPILILRRRLENDVLPVSLQDDVEDTETGETGGEGTEIDDEQEQN